MDVQPVSSKVAVGSTAALSTTPISVVVIWALDQLGLHVPPEVATALGAVIAGAAAFIGGWLKKEMKVSP